jgi:serine/threonine protein kinase/tetratricopeptide (TPR) repeat protein
MPKLDLNPQDAAALGQLLDQALDLAPGEREQWLSGLPVDYATLKPRLQELLSRAADVETADFLGTLPRFAVPPDTELPAGDQLQRGGSVGAYRLIRELGQGGMGTVWLAERVDGMLNRQVALKLPLASWLHEGFAERLARERDILASLEHPNIARLYDAGIAESGRPFLALEFVEGLPIGRYCQALHGRPAQLLAAKLRLFLQAARAVAYAHGKLVLHRDLKPPNILVTADGSVRLLDFGIAKVLTSGRTHDTELTEFAGRALSLEYASPEQILGEPLTVASDVYSLAVVLYELLAGTRPYRLTRVTRGALEDAVLHAEPERLSSVADAPHGSLLRGDLDTMVLHALRKDPSERYSTVHALIDDVERFLDGRPVRVRPDAFAYRAQKFVRRHKLAMAAASSVTLAVLAGSGVALWQTQVASEQRRKAEDIQEFITSIFTEADPFERNGAPVSAVTLLERARARVDRELADRPEQRVKMLSTIGSSLADMHEIEAGERALTEAVDVATRAYGSEALVTLHARADRLEISNYLDEPAKAHAELHALVSALRANDPHDGLLAQALGLQAVAQYEARDFDHAIESANEAYLVARRDFGNVNIKTARAAQLVAQTNEFAQRLDVAEKAARSAIEQTRAAVRADPDSGDLIEARMILVRVLGAEGKAKESIAEYTSVLEAARRHFGENSVEVAFHSVNLARRLLEAGDPTRAEGLFAEVIRIYTAKEKMDGKHRAAPYVWHAQALLALRDAAGALAEVTPAIAQLEKAGQPEQPALIHARVVAALAHAYLGNFVDGEAQFAAIPAPRDDAKDGRTVAGGRAHGGAREPPNELQARVFAARAEFARIRNDDAVAVSWAHKALDMAGPTAKLQRMGVLPGLGRALVRVHQFDEAEQALNEALKLSDEIQLGDSPERADAWAGLGELAAARGDCATARVQFDRSDRYWQTAQRNGQDSTGSGLSAMASRRKKCGT